MKITPLIYGYSRMKESMAFWKGDPNRDLPISFTFYLLQAEGKNILVDTGCTTMPGWEMTDFRGPAAALAEAGLTPADIDMVLITHAHHDHIEMASLYENAVFYIQQAEYQKGKKYLPEEAEVVTFEEIITPLPGIAMRRIGGHSEGSCIVELGNTIIAGDECYTRRNLLERIPTGAGKHPDRSRAFIEKYSKPQYTVLLCHEA